jgi:signal transduction histidine kinase
VVRVIVRSASGRALVHTGRRGGMPILWVVPSPTGREGAAVAPGRVQPTTRMVLDRTDGTGALHVESELEPMELLGPEALLDDAGPACVLADAEGRALARWPAGRARAEADAGERGVTAQAALRVEGWSPASPWALRCTQAARALGLLEPVAARYRASVALNASVMALTLLLGGFAVQQVRRRERLEAAAREEVRVRDLERRLFHAERLATVGRLAAGIAHEINNPLEGMTNYLALVRDALRAGDAPAAERHLAGVGQGLEHAAAVVRQVLLHADPAHTALGPVDLGDVLRDSFEFMRSRRDFDAVAFRLDLPDAPLRVRGSGVLLSQVVVNLMLNACEAQPRGGEVRVSARREGPRVWAEFADRGPGVDARDRERIFEPFFSTKDSTGLGLSICHAIARQHGGELSVEARAGGGALFRLALPALQE